jgi:hypothetical protein
LHYYLGSHDLVSHWVQEGTKRCRNLKLQSNTAAEAEAEATQVAVSGLWQQPFQMVGTRAF